MRFVHFGTAGRNRRSVRPTSRYQHSTIRQQRRYVAHARPGHVRSSGHRNHLGHRIPLVIPRHRIALISEGQAPIRHRLVVHWCDDQLNIHGGLIWQVIEEVLKDIVRDRIVTVGHRCRVENHTRGKGVAQHDSGCVIRPIVHQRERESQITSCHDGVWRNGDCQRQVCVVSPQQSRPQQPRKKY